MRAQPAQATYMSSKAWAPDKKHIASTDFLEHISMPHYKGLLEDTTFKALSTALGGQITIPHFHP